MKISGRIVFSITSCFLLLEVSGEHRVRTKRDKKEGNRTTRQLNKNADQMVQNILRWLQDVYGNQGRKVRQGSLREYLPPTPGEKPRPFTSRPSTQGTGVDEDGNFVDPGYPPAGYTPQPAFTFPPNQPDDGPGPEGTSYPTQSTRRPGYSTQPSITERPSYPGFETVYPEPPGGATDQTIRIPEVTPGYTGGTQSYPTSSPSGFTGYTSGRPSDSSSFSPSPDTGFPSYPTSSPSGFTGYPSGPPPGVTGFPTVRPPAPGGEPTEGRPATDFPDSTDIVYTSPPEGPGFPTSRPTGYPTGFPTARPTGFPTSRPTGYPTGFPTGRPTGFPTSRPTGYPTGFPTGRPTGFPTSRPTGYPTGFPTAQPTDSPTGPPETPDVTGYPTSRPGSYPTGPVGPPSEEETPVPTEQEPDETGGSGLSTVKPPGSRPTESSSENLPDFPTPGTPTDQGEPKTNGGEKSTGETEGTDVRIPTDEDLKHPPHIHALDVQCAKDMMTIEIEFNRQFDGVIYSKGYYNMPECRYVVENSGKTKYTFTVNLNMCGTEFINAFDTEGQSYLENVLVLQNEAGIQEVWDTVRAVRCLWEGNLKEQLSVQLMVGMLSQEIVTFSGDTAMAKLDVLLGRGPLGQPANGLVKIGEPMTLVVSVSGDPGFDLQVKDCKATDSSGDNVVPLTDDDGCILKPKLFGSFQKTRNTGDSGASIIAYAYFNAFKFPDVMDIMIECNIELCKTDCEMCQATDQQLEPGRRRRRDLGRANETLHDGVTMGKHLRVALQEDLLNLELPHQGVCMSTRSFVFASSALMTLLTGSCLVSTYFWFKTLAQKQK
ncbi:unnamed protein product [Phyllotreta striolata]|uniref:ZP domain-containing protein n=1 Tax=Phyllotreta striolata TaxID=444603 RepID=A0A9N9TRY7_PHYSR|nr:unnamed protein product [Phyllotreta striolata]